MSDGPSIQIGQISGGQNNIGKTEIQGDQVQNVHGGEQAITVEQFWDKLAEAIEDEAVVQEAIEPLRAMSALPPEEQKKPENQEKARGWIDKLKPYGTAAWKVCSAFTLGALKTYVSSNPIAAGTVAALESLQKGKTPTGPEGNRQPDDYSIPPPPPPPY